MIEQGSNRMRLLNVLWTADKACEQPDAERMTALRYALDALPDGWQELVEEEVVD